jgi:hypothetical protein
MEHNNNNNNNCITADSLNAYFSTIDELIANNVTTIEVQIITALFVSVFQVPFP